MEEGEEGAGMEWRREGKGKRVPSWWDKLKIFSTLARFFALSKSSISIADVAG